MRQYTRLAEAALLLTCLVGCDAMGSKSPLTVHEKDTFQSLELEIGSIEESLDRVQDQVLAQVEAMREAAARGDVVAAQQALAAADQFRSAYESEGARYETFSGMQRDLVEDAVRRVGEPTAGVVGAVLATMGVPAPISGGVSDWVLALSPLLFRRPRKHAKDAVKAATKLKLTDIVTSMARALGLLHSSPASEAAVASDENTETA